MSLRSSVVSIRQYGWLAIHALFLTLWEPGTATAQFPVPGNLQVPGNGKGIPQIPFFGEGNPLEQFFSGRDPAEMAEIRRIRVSVQEERNYGERVLLAMRDDLKRRGIDLVSQGVDVEYVSRLVATIRPAMRNRDRYRSVRVLVAQTDLTDAYSIPGGTIVMYRGMIDFAGSEAALVGVIGHELSHLDHGHQLLPLQRMKYVQRTPADFGRMDFDQFFRQASVFMSAFARPFRPEDETEADFDGAVWAYRAGYDPRAMSEMFARLNERDQFGQFVPGFLRTHPFHADRQAAIERAFQDLHRGGAGIELYVGRENVRRRIPMSVRRFDE